MKEKTTYSWKIYPENRPEEFSFVLATIVSPVDAWVEVVGYAGGKFNLPGRGETNFVSHWMPIPEPAIKK